MTEPERATVVETFEGWYEANWPRLVRVALGHLRSPSEAEDVVADTCFKLYRRWDDRRPDNPTAWASMVIARASGRHARKRSRTTGASGAAQSVHQELDLDLLAAIHRLPPRQRTAIALRYLADLTQAEVAAAMDIRPGTAGALLNQARTKLRSLLEER